jgi:hypothetical protein
MQNLKYDKLKILDDKKKGPLHYRLVAGQKDG